MAAQQWDTSRHGSIEHHLWRLPPQWRFNVLTLYRWNTTHIFIRKKLMLVSLKLYSQGNLLSHCSRWIMLIFNIFGRKTEMNHFFKNQSFVSLWKFCLNPIVWYSLLVWWNNFLKYFVFGNSLVVQWLKQCVYCQDPGSGPLRNY